MIMVNYSLIYSVKIFVYNFYHEFRHYLIIVVMWNGEGVRIGLKNANNTIVIFNNSNIVLLALVALL